MVQVLRDPDLGDRRRCSPPSARCSSRSPSHRLEHEFGAPAELEPHRLPGRPSHRRGVRRRLCAPSAGSHSCARADGTLVALFESRYRLDRLEADEPELTLEPIVAGERI